MDKQELSWKALNRLDRQLFLVQRDLKKLRKKQKVQYQGRDMTLPDASRSDVSGYMPAAEHSSSVSGKPLHEYYVSQLKNVDAKAFGFPDKCPDWFERYRSSILVPLGKIYNQFVDGGKPLFNTVNAFGRNYNDMIIALMNLEKACETGAFSEEQKGIIAGWLDDVFGTFPVNWRHLPLVVSPDVKGWKLKKADKDLKPALDANYDDYLKKIGRIAFVPPWMNKKVYGEDLGSIYFTYYNVRNDNVAPTRKGESLTATDLYKKNDGLYNWLVAFQDKEEAIKSSDLSEFEYECMKYRLSTVDEEIADIKRLQPKHKFKWTGLKSSDGLPVTAGKRSRSSNSGLEDHGQSFEPVNKQKRIEGSEVGSASREWAAQLPGSSQSLREFKSSGISDAPDLLCVNGTTLSTLGLTDESDLQKVRGEASSGGRKVLKRTGHYEVSGAQLMLIIESVLMNMLQPEEGEPDKSSRRIQLKEVSECLDHLSMCLHRHRESRNEVIAGGGEFKVLKKAIDEIGHCQKAEAELERLRELISHCDENDFSGQLKRYLEDDRSLKSHSYIEAVFSPELRPDNWLDPSLPPEPKALKIGQERLLALSDGLRQHLPEASVGGIQINHHLAVRLLVKELPSLLDKCSKQVSGRDKPSAEKDLDFMVYLIEHLNSLNYEQHLRRQQFPYETEMLKDTNSGGKGPALSDDQQTWRHVHILLPLKKPLESFIEEFRGASERKLRGETAVGEEFIEEIKRVISPLEEYFVESDTAPSQES
ncbi:hypothetical protein [Endozoicomonas lisbonensis]|uniref:hypothetical protein n=2 Tax=Endozoicomonas lisbonensis TaxID=3120522 RepID=UPI00339572BA